MLRSDMTSIGGPRVLQAVAVAIALATTAPAYSQAFGSHENSPVDYSKATLAPAKTCADMTRFKGLGLVSIQATEIAAAGATPAFCRIAGVLSPEVAFEVSLPLKWNNRFYMIGNGGPAGESLEDPGRVAQRNGALQLGFAFAQTNTGHDARKEPGASFVMSNPQKAIDYAYRAVHITATTGKAMAQDFYAQPVSKAYWNSCSNGGRQGLLEAQRYPEDFDGLLVNAPWADQTGFTVGAIWNHRAVAEGGLTAAKLPLLAEKVMAKCDALDGVKDGLIDDPRRCSFDAKRDVPACASGVDDASCLTAGQAEAINKIYRGPVSRGKSLFPGFMLGSEALVNGAGGARASAWAGTIVPAQPGGNAADFGLADTIIKYLVPTPPQPDYDYRKFDFDRDVPLLETWGRKANAKSTDLSWLNKRGGKVLMTYGWADQILQPLQGVHYYESVVAANGAKATNYLRLFMVPGMNHCSNGNGTDTFDAMTPLINWVEKGNAPAVIPASRVVAGKVVRTRPLCAYPKVARYSGKGSIDDAANFSCKAP